MDITKGSLDDISRPAASDRTRPGSRVSSVILSEGVRINQDMFGALEVLSSELTESQDIKENNLDFPSENLDSDQDAYDADNKDPELQKAILKMERLDRILDSKISNEKEVKRKGKELHQRLWKELKDHKAEGSFEDADEAENTRLFLALALNNMSEIRAYGKSSHSVNLGPDEKAKQIESSQGVMGKNKHGQDFIKKNIELASSAGSLWPMTDEEKKRLEQLLREIDEEDANVDPTSKSEIGFLLCAVSPTLGEGYTPQAAELNQVCLIYAKLQLLLPAQDFLSVRGLCGCCSTFQDKRSGERGERVLRDIKESREQEESLCLIQQQLQLFTQRQHPDENSLDGSGR